MRGRNQLTYRSNPFEDCLFCSRAKQSRFALPMDHLLPGAQAPPVGPSRMPGKAKRLSQYPARSPSPADFPPDKPEMTEIQTMGRAEFSAVGRQGLSSLGSVRFPEDIAEMEC